MTFYFRTFRRALSGIMLLVFTISIILSLFMLPTFSHSAVPWLLMIIESLSFMRTLWSITRKAVANSAQSVASEGIGLFGLFPFQLILALIVATTEFKDTIPHPVYVLLQFSVIVGSILHILYTVCLITIAMITVSTFDGDVWIRDIDSSPSPFPLPILREFFSPCVSKWGGRRKSTAAAETPIARPICILPCTCPPKGNRLEGSPRCSQTLERVGKPRSLPHTLVRVPDPAEQRASIVISFDVR